VLNCNYKHIFCISYWSIISLLCLRSDEAWEGPGMCCSTTALLLQWRPLIDIHPQRSVGFAVLRYQHYIIVACVSGPGWLWESRVCEWYEWHSCLWLSTCAVLWVRSAVCFLARRQPRVQGLSTVYQPGWPKPPPITSKKTL